MADDTATDGATAPASTEPGSGRRRWLIIGGIALAVLVIAGGAVAVIAAQDDDTPSYDTAQIGWMHQGCQQWTDSYQGTGDPNTAWCTSMTDWMNQRTGTDASSQNGMMMGSMMWQDAASMATTCEQWMATNPSGTDANAWCGQMTDWMNQHMGDWDTWMMNGPMMGNP